MLLLKKINKLLENQEMFKPPKSAGAQAKKAIDWKEKYGDEVDAGTKVGWTRARQLVNGDEVSYDIVKRMYSFFSRHKGNEKINPENKDKPWRDNGYVAWLIWGGDPAYKWASDIVQKKKNEEVPKKYLKGIPKNKIEDREKEIEKRSKEDEDDPKSYRPFKTDKGIKGQKSPKDDHI